MTNIERILALNDILLEEMPQHRQMAKQYSADEAQQRRLLRGLMNLRPPMPLRQDYLALQDALLCAERAQKGIVEADALPAVAADPRVVLWQGDITRLAADAIVNAANSGLTGCYHPNHNCIDNCIHSAAGAQLRLACQRLMDAQGHEEPTGYAKATPGFNLPSRYVIHTVGPIVSGGLTTEHRRLLASCYQSCLTLAAQMELETIAFPCISTGVFGYPQRAAAKTALQTVHGFLAQNGQIKRVIYNVFTDTDREIYTALLRTDCTAEKDA